MVFLSDSAKIRPINRGDNLDPSLERLKNAYAVAQQSYANPEGEVRAVYDGGVYYEDGRVCESARHISTSTENVPSQVWLDPIRTLEGNYLYGGLMRNHFGHFLVESIGRLWALDKINEKLDGIIYQPLHGAIGQRGIHINQNYQVKSYIRRFLKIIGADLPLLFPTGVWKVEILNVPGQLLMNSPTEGIGGHPILHSFLKRRFDDYFDSEVKPVRSIYLSRARIPLINSVYLQEKILEQNLIKNGYEIIYPEMMSIEDQLLLYREAKNILIAQGSSAHLVALTAHEEQKIGIINRQKARYSPGKFERQIRAFGCSSCYTFDAVDKQLKTVDLYENLKLKNTLISVLNFSKLGKQLSDGDFIDISKWEIPSSDNLNLAKLDARAILREETLYPT